MADIFRKPDVVKLIHKKNIWFFGDSNMRGIYKDLIWLLEKNSLIYLSSLRGKLEGSFMNDILVKGGSLHRGRNFQEIRHYQNFVISFCFYIDINLQRHRINIEYTFLTQCYSKDLVEKLQNCHKNEEKPDVIAINSCLWDLTRWGPESVAKYKKNIQNLITLLKGSLPPKTRVIWITTPPISKEPRGGFFIKQIEFLKHTLRFDVMEANTFVSREFTLQGFDVLDIHYHLLLQIHRRRPDGIHWSPEAMRHMTNLFLTHISICWNVPLPGNFKSPLLKDSHLQVFKTLPSSAPTENSVKPEAEATDKTDTKSTEPLKNDTKSTNNLKSSLPKKSRKRRKSRGKKRDGNGNLNLPRPIDFTLDDFDCNFETKRFKFGY